MFQIWLRKLRAKRETTRAVRRRNQQLLEHVAVSVLDEYNSLPYATLAAPCEFDTATEAIVDGVWIHWQAEEKMASDGAIKIVIKLHTDLSKPGAETLRRSIVKRPNDVDAPRRDWRWFRPITTVRLENAEARWELPDNGPKDGQNAVLGQAWQFLDQIADAVVDEYKSLPYQAFADLQKLSTSVVVIVDDVRINWNFDYQQRRNGNLEVDFDFYSDLFAHAGPARSFLKRPEDTGTRRENLRWVRMNPIFRIDGDKLVPV